MSSSNPIIPDLSLHISLPNSAPSSICTTTNEPDSSLGLKSLSDSAAADTELCLANNNNNSALEAESPWRRSRREAYHQNQRNLFQCSQGISVLDLSGLKPIKGIPVYNNNDNHHIEMDPRFRLYQAPPYSASSGGGGGGGGGGGWFNGITMEALRHLPSLVGGLLYCCMGGLKSRLIYRHKSR